MAYQVCRCPIVPEGETVLNSPVCGQYLFMMLLESFLWGTCRISTPCKRVESVEPDDTYDFIVVGAGTAGSIVAGRLSEDSDNSVLIIEAGGPEPIGARVPSLYRSFWHDKKVDWDYRTELGNYCLDQGDQGCSWTRGKCVEFNYQPRAVYTLLEAIEEAGLPLIEDINDPNTPEGFAISQAFNDNGQRYTTARAYLTPQSETPNLNLKTYGHVTKVLLEGTRAVDVEYLDSSGARKTVRARKEVILSAGTLNSPQILMLSGIGPKETLETFDIPVLADLPVGKNLKNHIGVTIYYLVTSRNNTATLDWNGLTDYLLTANGPMSSTGLTQLTGFLYSRFGDRDRKQPDLQFFINGYYAECSKTGVIGEAVTDRPGYNVTVNAVSLLPRSVGYLTLRSSNPLDAPIFYANYLDHPDDMLMIKDGIDYLKKLFFAKTELSDASIELDPYYSSVCDEKAEQWSDEWNECMIRQYTDPQNHQTGTTSLGSVVDDELKVLGIENLRVCDAGVLPAPPTGNPQGVIMVVGEKCADYIKQKWQS